MYVNTKSNDERLRAIFRALIANQAPEYPYIFFAKPLNEFERKHNALLGFFGGVKPNEIKEVNHWLGFWESRIAQGIY
jgi:hypothetical protein